MGIIECLISPQGSGKATVLWTSSTVSYSTFKILNVEEFKKRHVSVYVCVYVCVILY